MVKEKMIAKIQTDPARRFAKVIRQNPVLQATRKLRVFCWLATLALVLTNVLLPATVYAQSAPSMSTADALVTDMGAGLQVESQAGGLLVQWQGSVSAAATGESAGPTASYGGYLLPMQTLLIELPADSHEQGAMAAVAMQGINSAPYAGELTPAPQSMPPAIDYVPSPTNTPYVEQQLPAAPVFVLSEGWQRNRHLAVLGFSAIYQDPASGQVMAVASMAATIANATVASDAAMITDAVADPNDAALFAPLTTQADAPGPTNPLANTTTYKLFVNAVGIQQISGKQLADAGLASPKASKLRVFYLGQELPLHIIDNNSNDVLNHDDYLRFYAPAAGDALNPESVYWLTVGTVDGARMGQRAVTAGGAATRNTAYEVGHYAKNSIYRTEFAGDDADNWFQADLVAQDGDASYAVTLTHQLPLNGALPTLLTLHLTPYSVGLYGDTVSHRLQLSTSGFSTTDSWGTKFSGPLPFQNLTRNVSLNKAADTWTLTLLQESAARATLVDGIDYLLPVQLDFGGKGAIIQGVNGTWRYQFTNTATNPVGGRALYDITDPHAPQRLAIPGGANFDIQDGDTAHRYLLLGDGTYFAPAIQAHSAVNLGGGGAAHTIYIAPKAFQAALQPLVDQRKSQGYQVRVVDVQAIYDSWSYGMVDPKAIRSFLRYAAGHWSPAPIAAILVGDGTTDALNYLGYGNPNVIPAYVVNADPWIKYVPCDSCYGQLEGDDPAGDNLIDIWIGRFPVVDDAELGTVVNKIVNYENNSEKLALWRGTSVQLADDDVRPDNTVDDAGPFIGSAEHVISLMPASMRQLRNYFSAATDYSNVPDTLMTLMNSLKQWFVSDEKAALQRSINLMGGGAGIVTYTGHSNHWYWARISQDGEDNSYMFGLNEVRSLHNINAPSISMSMTCYTSQFNVAAPLHYTLDERLFLWGGGGAVATWGPTGFSIVPAHDTLQAGFHRLLWKSPAQQAKLGALVRAGYEEIVQSGQNYDVTKTFVLFGDPLMPARVTPVDAIFMPKLTR